MDIVEFESNIVEGKYIRVPADIVDKIGDYSRIGVILKVSRDTIQNDRTNEEARIQTAFDEYRAKYPDDEVSLDDFCYVGILSETVNGGHKNDLVDAIEAKYDGI